MKHNEYNLFPTLVVAYDLTGLVDNKKLIEDYNGQKHMLVDGNGTSNYSGGGWNLDHYKGLRETLQECVDLYASKLNLCQTHITNTWMNKMDPGGKVKPHRHEGSVVSGAYYPTAPKEAANLIFHSPISMYRMNDVFIAENDANTYFNFFPVQESILYIFPSWLQHETEINTVEDRYVLSLNTARTV